VQQANSLVARDNLADDIGSAIRRSTVDNQDFPKLDAVWNLEVHHRRKAASNEVEFVEAGD
jgi:hypothetical protein